MEPLIFVTAPRRSPWKSFERARACNGERTIAKNCHPEPSVNWRAFLKAALAGSAAGLVTGMTGRCKLLIAPDPPDLTKAGTFEGGRLYHTATVGGGYFNVRAARTAVGGRKLEYAYIPWSRRGYRHRFP